MMGSSSIGMRLLAELHSLPLWFCVRWKEVVRRQLVGILFRKNRARAAIQRSRVRRTASTLIP